MRDTFNYIQRKERAHKQDGYTHVAADMQYGHVLVSTRDLTQASPEAIIEEAMNADGIEVCAYLVCLWNLSFRCI